MSYWRRPANVTRAYADGRFGQVHYRIAHSTTARERPILFIHSSPSSGRMWELTMSAMAADRMAIAADTPGFGDSDAPAVPPEISDYAAALGDLVGSLGLEQIDIVGYHTGSKICVELALQRPSLVRRLALVSVPIYTSEELANQKRDYADPGIPRDGSHLGARWAFMMKWRRPDVPLIVAQRSFADSLKVGQVAHWGHRAAFNYHHADNLPKVTQPVLVFNFDDDLRLQTARVAPYLKNGRVIDLPWAHGSIDVHTTEFVRHLRQHFDAPDHERPAGGAALKTIPPAPAPAKADIIRRRSFLTGRYGLVHLRHAIPAAAPDRPALFLLHMSPNSGRIYETFQREMARDRRVVAIDTPGFGESDAPPTPPTIEDYARQMGEVADALGIAALDVMGYHTGSLIAVELAVQRSSLVRHVVMVSAPFYTEQERAQRHARNKPIEIRPDGSHNVERFKFLWQFYGADVPGTIIGRNFAESLRGGPMSWWGHQAAFDYDLRDRLPAVAAPILLLNPHDDLAEQTPRAKDLITNGHLHDLPGYKHGMLDVHSEEIGSLLRRFLDR